MIDKLNDDAYFVVDETAFFSQISFYDPTVASQIISNNEISVHVLLDEVEQEKPDINEFPEIEQDMPW